MRKGRPKVALILTTDERQRLESLAHRSRSAAALARRARIILACADGADSKVVARRLHVQTIYKPVFEDWLFHAVLPVASYVTLATAAGAAWSHPRAAMFMAGAAALLLLFVGIHNAWDTVTYIVVLSWEKRDSDKETSSDGGR